MTLQECVLGEKLASKLHNGLIGQPCYLGLPLHVLPYLRPQTI